MRPIGLAVVLTICLLAMPLLGEPQQTEKVRRIGFLSGTIRSPEVEDGLRQGLRENGYVEGQNLLIEWRFAEGKSDRLRSFAGELVGLKVEVIVTLSSDAVLAVKSATASIPVVFTQVPDPVAQGVVSNLARPGGNLTGFSILAIELTGKRLELLKEAVPALRSATFLSHRGSTANPLALNEAESAASRLGLKVHLAEVRDADELEPALTRIARERDTSVVLVPSTWIVAQGSRIAELAIRRRLPVLAWTDAVPLRGSLMSYGPSTSEVLRRAGGQVAKILNGAKPGDLPVEQPTKFELIINLKTAKALGLTIPPSVLRRADQIIE